MLAVPDSCQSGTPNKVQLERLWGKVFEHLSRRTLPPEFSRAKSNFWILSALYFSSDIRITCSTSYNQRGNTYIMYLKPLHYIPSARDISNLCHFLDYWTCSNATHLRHTLDSTKLVGRERPASYTPRGQDRSPLSYCNLFDLRTSQKWHRFTSVRNILDNSHGI